jgi:hypothetical protein
LLIDTGLSNATVAADYFAIEDLHILVDTPVVAGL